MNCAEHASWLSHALMAIAVIGCGLIVWALIDLLELEAGWDDASPKKQKLRTVGLYLACGVVSAVFFAGLLNDWLDRLC